MSPHPSPSPHEHTSGHQPQARQAGGDAVLVVHPRHRLMAGEETRQLIRRHQEIDGGNDQQDDTEQGEDELHWGFPSEWIVGVVETPSIFYVIPPVSPTVPPKSWRRCRTRCEVAPTKHNITDPRTAMIDRRTFLLAGVAGLFSGITAHRAIAALPAPDDPVK